MFGNLREDAQKLGRCVFVVMALGVNRGVCSTIVAQNHVANVNVFDGANALALDNDCGFQRKAFGVATPTARPTVTAFTLSAIRFFL